MLQSEVFYDVFHILGSILRHHLLLKVVYSMEIGTKQVFVTDIDRILVIS